ncbi:helix-turn-helix domain-containing protein [Lactococcus taiwanensis]|uniref:helix-turn-helix domain-containing protein n=1 Tax=Lactococcus taiwanensis TaxID=1151742 RepID=UPI0028AE052D|nr:helix-turn-helix transcriptional regulator [Lactococcus taiwanensis]
MTIFERVKELSEKQGKSLQKVSEDLGFSSNYFYRMKKQQPTADKLIKIADYFNVRVDYLLDRNEREELHRQFRQEGYKYKLDYVKAEFASLTDEEFSEVNDTLLDIFSILLTYRKEPEDAYKTEYQLYLYLLDLIKSQVDCHENTVTGQESLGQKANYEKNKKDSFK